jgi:hypothetical protein
VTFQDEQKDTVFLTQQDNYDNMWLFALKL